MTDEQPMVWALAFGSYSYYRVLCICPTEDDAERLAAKVNLHEQWEQADVQSFPVCDATVVPVEVMHLSVTLWDDGREDERVVRLTEEWPWGYSPAVPLRWRWVRAPMHNDKGGRLEVSGTDHERVRRVFSDRKAQIKAEDALRLKKETGGQS